MPFKRGVGRPKKDLNVKKSVHKSIRFDTEIMDKLYLIKTRTGLSDSEIIRKGIEKIFMEELKK